MVFRHLIFRRASCCIQVERIPTSEGTVTSDIAYFQITEQLLRPLTSCKPQMKNFPSILRLFRYRETTVKVKAPQNDKIYHVLELFPVKFGNGIVETSIFCTHNARWP